MPSLMKDLFIEYLEGPITITMNEVGITACAIWPSS
jgi:hypothetical protein